MKRIHLLSVMAAMIAMLSGCSNYVKDYDKNTLVVKNNNSLVEISVEDFNGTNVTEENLTEYIDEQIDAYNSVHEKNSVKEIVIETEDMSKVKLVIAYKDIESYNGFNALECVLDDFYNIDAEMLKGTYTSVADDSEVSFDKLTDTEDAKVLVLSENTDVVIRGEILYYNKEVTLNDGIAACSGKENAVIIFN